MKREEKNQQTRRRIMDSALAEFAKQGYGASSVNSICADLTKDEVVDAFRQYQDFINAKYQIAGINSEEFEKRDESCRKALNILLYGVIEIGMLHSDIALTAVGVTIPLLLIMVSIENIFAAGAAVLAGRQLGAKDNEGASRTVTTIIGLSIAIGVALCVGGIIFIEPLLRSFGASDASLPLAKDYAFWMFVAALANLPAQSMNCAARAESSVKISSAAVITGALLNVVLDPVFMFEWGLGMGVEGASMATTVSQFVTFGILTWFYLSGRSVIKIKVRSFHLSWDLIKTVAAPLPNADEIIAAYGVVQRLILIGCYVVMGFMQGYQPVASYAFGAKDEDRFHQSVRFALKGSILLTVLVAAVYILLSEPFILILPKLLGVTGIYFAQPAADILTLLICVFSVKSMKRIASANMLGNGDIEKKVEK